MADILVTQGEARAEPVKILLWKDMGDGTHALVGASVIESGNVIVDSGLISIKDAGGGTVWSQPHTDETTGAAATIEYEHHEIHEGSSFHTWYEQTVSDSGDETIIAFRTPNTSTYLHLVPHFLAAGAAHARMLEAPTITDNTGAPLAVYNRRRVGTPSAPTIWDTSQSPDVQGQATYFTEATQGNVTGGTEISHWHLQTDAGNKPAGDGERAINEWVLKPNTLYAFVIESLVAAESVCTIRLNW